MPGKIRSIGSEATWTSAWIFEWAAWSVLGSRIGSEQGRYLLELVGLGYRRDGEYSRRYGRCRGRYFDLGLACVLSLLSLDRMRS